MKIKGCKQELIPFYWKLAIFFTYRGGTSTRARYMLNANMSLQHELSSETSLPQPKLNGMFLYRICILCKSCVAMTEAYDKCFANIRQIIFESFVDDA